MPNYGTHQYGFLPKSWIMQLCSYYWLFWEFVACGLSIPGGSLALFLPNPSLCLDSGSVFPFVAPRALPAFLEHLLILENCAPSSGHMWSWNRDPWTPCALFQAIIETTLLGSEQPLRGHTGKLVEKFSDTDFWIPLFQMPSG